MDHTAKEIVTKALEWRVKPSAQEEERHSTATGSGNRWCMTIDHSEYAHLHVCSPVSRAGRVAQHNWEQRLELGATTRAFAM